MKQIVKIHDVIGGSYFHVSHRDVTYDIEIVRNRLQPELVNLTMGEKTIVVNRADLQKALGNIEKEPVETE